MNLRTFNDAGIDAFQRFLDNWTPQTPSADRDALLTDSALSSELSPATKIAQQPFPNRLEAARYLDALFQNVGLTDVEQNRGLWCWLSLFYFEQLVGRARGGLPQLGARERWVPATENFRRYYRHLLAAPYQIFKAHRHRPERALALLWGPLNSPGDIVEQLASRQELVTNPGTMETATLLYIEPSTGKPKRGAGGKGPGSPRRLASVLAQFDVTWDMYSITSDRLVRLLPGEFQRFLPGSGSTASA